MPHGRSLSPPQYARRLGTYSEKVLHWIKTGELRALNAARDPNGKPRYKITPEAIAEFEARRASNREVANA